MLLIFLGFAKVCTQVLDIGFLFYPNIFSFQKLKIFVSQNASIMINDTSIIICECSASVTSLVILRPIYLSISINQCEKCYR